MAEIKRLEIGNDEIEDALERKMSEPEQRRARRLAGQVVDAFEREAFGELTNYGFGHGTVTQRVKSDGGQLHLPYRVVQSVQSVRNARGDDIEYEWADWHAQTVHTRLDSRSFGVVTYDWELEAGPATIDLLADCVARALLTPKDVRAGANQMTSSTGPFSQTKNFANWTVGGQAILSPEDRKAAQAYRPNKRGHTWVMGS